MSRPTQTEKNGAPDARLIRHATSSRKLQYWVIPPQADAEFAANNKGRPIWCREATVRRLGAGPGWNFGLAQGGRVSR